MKGKYIWYFNTTSGKKEIYNDLTVASRETGIVYDTLQKHVKKNGGVTLKGGHVFEALEIKK